MIYSIFIFSLFLFVFSLIAFVPGKNLFQKILSPFGFYIAAFSFLYYLVPAMQVYFEVGRSSFLVSDNQGLMLLSTFYATVYFFFSCLAFFVLSRPPLNFEAIMRAARNFDSRSRFSLGFCLVASTVGLLFVFTILRPYFGNYSSFMYDRINMLSGYGYQLKLMSYSLPFVMLSFLRKSCKLSNFPVFVFVFVFGFANILLGSRTGAVIAIPYLYLVYILFEPHSRANGKQLFKAVFFIVLLFAFVASMVGLRDAVKKDGFDAVTDIDHNARENSFSEDIVSQIYGNYGQSELLALLISRSDQYDEALGYTFLAGFVSFVPRAIWPDKPVGGGPMLANIVSPGAYALGSKEGNSSLTTGLPIEGFLNFGFPGLMFIGFLHGLIIVLLTRYSNKLKTSLDFVIYVILFHRVSFVLLTGEFMGVFSGVVFLVLPLFLISRVRFGVSS